MSMSFCIGATELRKALAEIEVAESNGFNHCLAVFDMAQVGRMLTSCLAEYSDLSVRGDATDASLDWGRFSSVHRTHKLKRRKLVPIRTQANPGSKHG